jgi:hypothetical protein
MLLLLLLFMKLRTTGSSRGSSNTLPGLFHECKEDQELILSKKLHTLHHRERCW